MPTQIRKLSPDEILALTPTRLNLAPIFDKLPTYASEDGALLLGEVDGTPAAVAALEQQGDTLHVDHFAVSPRFRGHGLGGALMRAVLSEARRREAKTVRAMAPSWCPEWRAFYTRLGFNYTDPDTRDTQTDMTPVELQIV